MWTAKSRGAPETQAVGESRPRIAAHTLHGECVEIPG